ncbi:enoyl-CoA hydratase-related protein [Gordonia rubripertincta]|uniref:Enoyl-CoA hydratase-related protein n=1 Tax=Gordonia rubripertincta TaxID=36822 RepID=A0ABT4MRQ8_GORRU|nr:enoyl-CoA hydratase-related protein [Gordonia rubripertincta]MCZ4548971.1 enoyl-CoA hydratase-related protein [Gordonia rubripertincta]
MQALNGLIASVDDRGVARVQIDRPHRKNAMDTATSNAFIELLGEWADNEAIRVVVIGAGGRDFCTGADIVDMASAPAPQSAAEGEDRATKTIDTGCRVVRAIRALEVPVVAAVGGPAAGIGASIAFASDLIYAASDAYFLLAFVNIGLMPDGAATATVAAAVGRARANELALLGERLPAAQAYADGLVTAVVDADALDAKVDHVVGKLLAASPRALKITKKALDAQTLAGFDLALELERQGQIELLQSPEFAALIAAFARGKTAKPTPATP